MVSSDQRKRTVFGFVRSQVKGGDVKSEVKDNVLWSMLMGGQGGLCCAWGGGWGRGRHEQAVTSAMRTACRLAWMCVSVMTLIITTITYIYHALINALSAHMIHINLNMIFYTHVEHSLT